MIPSGEKRSVVGVRTVFVDEAGDERDTVAANRTLTTSLEHLEGRDREFGIDRTHLVDGPRDVFRGQSVAVANNQEPITFASVKCAVSWVRSLLSAMPVSVSGKGAIGAAPFKKGRIAAALHEFGLSQNPETGIRFEGSSGSGEGCSAKPDITSKVLRHHRNLTRHWITSFR